MLLTIVNYTLFTFFTLSASNLLLRYLVGTVIAAGPGRVHPETAFQLDIAAKVNDNVIYGKYDGTELKYNDMNHQMIKDDDVLLKYPSNAEPSESNVECVKDQVLIKLPPKEDTSSAGLIITTAEKEKRTDYGTVVKVGPGRQAGNGQYMPIQVQPGTTSVSFRNIDLYCMCLCY